MSVVLLNAVRWCFSTLADHVESVFSQAEADLRLEQAVYGLDAKDELQLQNLLADGLAANYSVAREVHYPSSAGRKLTHRQRCDIVLTPAGRELRLDSAPATLFDAPDLCSADEAALARSEKSRINFAEGGIRHGGYGA